MLKGIKGIAGLTAAAFLVVAIAYAGYMSSQSQPADGQLATGNAAARIRVTLDPQEFQGNARDAYKVAERNPALLAQLHCYCGCDKTDGHKNLLDCFRDKHGASCEICVDEAEEAQRLAQQGTAVEQIRDFLRERFAHGS